MHRVKHLECSYNYIASVANQNTIDALFYPEPTRRLYFPQNREHTLLHRFVQSSYASLQSFWRCESEKQAIAWERKLFSEIGK